MPARLTLRAWAIDKGNGDLVATRGLPFWCPALMFRRPAALNRALKLLRLLYPGARPVRVRVTIEDVHADAE